MNADILIRLVASRVEWCGETHTSEFSNSSTVSAQVSANELMKELSAQAILPLVSFPDILEWKKRSTSVIASNLRITYEHVELHDLLSSNNIPYVILKGVASASYYRTPILRTLGDVDFLIYSDDIPLVTSLLHGIGFVETNEVDKAEQDKVDSVWSHGRRHVAFHRDGSTWEMHRSVNGVPEGKKGELIRNYLSDIIETAVPYETGNGTVFIPDQFHHGLILLLHTASHLTSEGIGLRHLCDWAMFVSSFSCDSMKATAQTEQWKWHEIGSLTDDFSSMFCEPLKACGLWRFAQLLSLTCVKYLNMPYQYWMGEADDVILEALIMDVVEGGNFGKKSDDRYRQIKYITNRRMYTVSSKSPILQLFRTIDRKAEQLRITRTAVIYDYIKMVATGQRKIDNGNTVRKATKRKKLYLEFKLFEDQNV